MRVELRNWKFTTELVLPADRYQLRDALDKLRLYNESKVDCLLQTYSKKTGLME